MKRLIHKFIGHNWVKTEQTGWDYSEPHDPRMGSDWLPTKWQKYTCSCRTNRIVFHDELTHLGVDDDRVFIYVGDYPRWENLVK